MSSCGLCESAPASCQCATCDLLLCESCDGDLHRPAKLRSHVRQPLLAATAAAASSSAAPQLCSVCESEPATVDCADCANGFCAACDSAFHAPAKLRGHNRMARPTAATTTTTQSAAVSFAPLTASNQLPPSSSAPPASVLLASYEQLPAPAVRPVSPRSSAAAATAAGNGAAVPLTPLSPRFSASSASPLAATLKGASLSGKHSSLSALLSAASATSPATPTLPSPSVPSSTMLSSLIRPASSPVAVSASTPLTSSLLSSPLGRRTTAPTAAVPTSAALSSLHSTSGTAGGGSTRTNLLSPFHTRLASSPINSLHSANAATTAATATATATASAAAPVVAAQLKAEEQTIPGSAAGRVLCSVCEESQASLQCQQCATDFCAACDDAFHQPKKMRAHVRTNIAAADQPTMAHSSVDAPAATKSPALSTASPASSGSLPLSNSSPPAVFSPKTSVLDGSSVDPAASQSSSRPNAATTAAASTVLTANPSHVAHTAAATPASVSSASAVSATAAAGHRVSVAEGGVGLESFTSYSSIINRLANMETSIKQQDRDRAASQHSLQQTVEHMQQTMQTTLQMVQQQQQQPQSPQDQQQELGQTPLLQPEEQQYHSEQRTPASPPRSELVAQHGIKPEYDETLRQVQRSAKADLDRTAHTASSHSQPGTHRTHLSLHCVPGAVSLLSQLLTAQAEATTSMAPDSSSAPAPRPYKSQPTTDRDREETATEQPAAADSSTEGSHEPMSGQLVEPPVLPAAESSNGGSVTATVAVAHDAVAAAVPVVRERQRSAPLSSVYLPSVAASSPVGSLSGPSGCLSSVSRLLGNIDFSALAERGAQCRLAAATPSSAASALIAHFRQQAHIASQWRKQQTAQHRDAHTADSSHITTGSSSSKAGRRSGRYGDSGGERSGAEVAGEEEESKQQLTIASHAFVERDQPITRRATGRSQLNRFTAGSHRATQRTRQAH